MHFEQFAVNYLTKEQEIDNIKHHVPLYVCSLRGGVATFLLSVAIYDILLQLIKSIHSEFFRMDRGGKFR